MRNMITPPEHPHVSGENLGFWVFMPPILGTSPREWGKPDPMQAAKEGTRNIPT